MKCYFLIWRVSKHEPFDISKPPIGGLEMVPCRVLVNEFGQRVPVADFLLAHDLAELRYAPNPDERLVVAEVFELKDQVHAKVLHRLYEKELREFEELMA